MDLGLSGKVALVTGSSRGIGRGIALRLVEEGANVLFCARGAHDLDAAVGAASRPGRAAGVVADVTTPAGAATVVETAIERFGGIDIVVANAGLATAASFAETSLADWDRNNSVLAKGVFLVTREAFKVMTAQKLGGSIVTIGSKNALASSGGASAYCAAKAAAVHLTRCIAFEGRLLVVGFAGGRIADVAGNRVLLKNVSVVGVHWGLYRQRDATRVRRWMVELLKLAEARQLTPVIWRSFPLERAARALAAIGGRESYGKVVLIP